MAVAGKTGTTEDYNDLWFVGYTPYYTCAVWSGYDGNQKLPDDARNFHKNLWRKVMSRIHQGMAYKDFDQPASVEKVAVCADSGLLPMDGCPVIEEYFDVGTIPTEYCELHYYEEYDEEEQDMEIYDQEQLDPNNPDGANTDNPNTPDNPDNPDNTGNTETPDNTDNGTGGDTTGGGDITYYD